jgi:membrane-bound lytic murein transglycosylase
MEEYQRPRLKPPPSYDECHQALQEIDDKIRDALSSPSRAQYKVITESTGACLMHGSLRRLVPAQFKLKRKLHARKSLGKGGSILAHDALQKIKDKRRQEADDKLKRAATVAGNKAQNAKRDNRFRHERTRRHVQPSSEQVQDSLASRFLIQYEFQFKIRKRTQQPSRKRPFAAAPISRCTMRQ